MAAVPDTQQLCARTEGQGALFSKGGNMFRGTEAERRRFTWNMNAGVQLGPRANELELDI